jgi:chloramphenicol 3-O-phosphotransferase
MLDSRIAGAVHLLIFLGLLFAVAFVVVTVVKRRLRSQNEFDGFTRERQDNVRQGDDWDVPVDGSTKQEEESTAELLETAELLPLDPSVFPYNPDR